MRYTIVLGAMKAGTSSMFYYLSESENYAPSKVKETHFFSDDRLYRVDGYDDCWDGGPGASVRLEASPAYGLPKNSAKVADRMSKELDGHEVRLVFMARDPL
jgi:hypothetical protein